MRFPTTDVSLGRNCLTCYYTAAKFWRGTTGVVVGQGQGGAELTLMLLHLGAVVVVVVVVVGLGGGGGGGEGCLSMGTVIRARWGLSVCVDCGGSG